MADINSIASREQAQPRRWDQIDLKRGLVYVGRLKNRTPSNQPIRGPEIRALRRMQRDYPETPYVFVTERKGPLIRQLPHRVRLLRGIPLARS
jgi:type 1 fimbriae regulatory protein FimB/type 1 fimbriae regulatory protein FimE